MTSRTSQFARCMGRDIWGGMRGEGTDEEQDTGALSPPVLPWEFLRFLEGEEGPFHMKY